MARIAGVDLPREKRAEIGLTYIYGIGKATANEILAKAEINPDTRIKDLSQPGQYACKERVTISGPRGKIDNVVVLGPPRNETQVEVSFTDALVLGSIPPVKLSGDLENTPEITISTERASIVLNRGLMVAKRHIHMTPEDAIKFGVSNNESVKVKVLGKRPLIFDDVIVRVSKDYRTFMHIDYDEANACGFSKGTFALIVGKDEK